MKRSRPIFVGLVLLSCLVVIVFCRRSSTEPIVKGKRISKWVDEFYLMNHARSPQPAEVLRDFGAEAIPYMVKALERRDSLPRKIYMRTYPVLPNFLQGRLPRLYPARGLRMNVAGAFREFGPKAKAAVPHLIKALDDPDVAPNASLALGDIGPDASPAIPVLLRFLHGKDSQMRVYAILALPKIAPESAEIREAVAHKLTDAEAEVRRHAAIVLGALGPKARDTVPHLRKMLSDPVSDVRTQAAAAIKQIDPEATTGTEVK